LPSNICSSDVFSSLKPRVSSAEDRNPLPDRSLDGSVKYHKYSRLVLTLICHISARTEKDVRPETAMP
jgi:hypothetical protein